MKLFDKLCQPAKFYFVLSVISYIFILLQNLGATNRFHLGNYSCTHSNPALVLISQGLYILLWTWLLNVICKVNPGISWVIVLFPFLLFFILLGLLLFQGTREDFRDGALSQFTS
jgi:uncharacterized membrane protein